MATLHPLRDKAEKLQAMALDLSIPKAEADLFAAKAIKYWEMYLVYLDTVTPAAKPPRPRPVVVKETIYSPTFKSQTVVFSGFRNATWARTIEKKGGVYKENLTKDATILVVNNAMTNKKMKAIAWGIKIMTPEQFYNLLAA